MFELNYHMGSPERVLPYLFIPLSIILCLILIRYAKDMVKLPPAKAYSETTNFERDIDKMKFISRIFVACLLICLLIGFAIHFGNDIFFKIKLLICLHFFGSFLFCTFTLIRRRIKFYEGKPFSGLFFNFFRGLSNDRFAKFVQATTTLAIIVGAFYLYWVDPDKLHELNALLYLFGFVVLLLFFSNMLSSFRVHAHYGSHEDNNKAKWQRWFHVVSRVLAIALFLIWFNNVFVNAKQMHSIPLVKKSKAVKRDSSNFLLLNYLDELTNKHDRFFLVANEGGGLRANLWSQYVLNKLDNVDSLDFYNRTIATCGASGGAIGMGLFHLSKSQDIKNETPKELDDHMNSFVESDFLGLDVFSLLFSRTACLLNPSPADNSKLLKDHERRGDLVQARKYAALATQGLDRDSSYNLSIEDWWYEARNLGDSKDSATQNHLTKVKEKRHIPIPIINTAHIETGKEGVISPLLNNKNIFNGDHIINDFYNHPAIKEGKSLAYVDALFLANRFPLVSPVANIPGKGNYHDAGAFDNSGISSLLDLISYVEKMAETSGKDSVRWANVWEKLEGKMHLIIIQNSIESYARDLKKDWKGKIDRISTQENLKSNLISAINTSAVKEYLHTVAYQKKGVWFADVHEFNLGYLLEDKRTLDFIFGGQLKVDTLWSNIVSHDSLLTREFSEKNSFYIKPPLGRVMAEPIKDWMQMQVDGKRIRERIEELKKQK